MPTNDAAQNTQKLTSEIFSTAKYEQDRTGHFNIN